MHDYALFIGRFQPFHQGHLLSIRFGFSIAKKVIVAIGGAYLSPSPIDPFRASDRKKMIVKSLTSSERKRVKFIFIRDRLYNEELWKENLATEVLLATTQNADIVIIGHDKDQTSYYLKIFPQWKFIETGDFFHINGTQIRATLFQKLPLPKKDVSEFVYKFLSSFQKTNQFKIIKSAYDYYGMKSKNHADGMLFDESGLEYVLLRFGHYALFKKRKQIPSQLLYELPLFSNIPLSKEYLKYLKIKKSFYTQKYDGPNKNGRTISYYHIPSHIKFDIKIFSSSEYQWLLLDNLALHEKKMFADYYQIIYCLLPH